MQLPYSEELNIEYLGRLFDNTSECYKFFWFDALITKVIDGKNEIDYEVDIESTKTVKGISEELEKVGLINALYSMIERNSSSVALACVSRAMVSV